MYPAKDEYTTGEYCFRQYGTCLLYTSDAADDRGLGDVYKRQVSGSTVR